MNLPVGEAQYSQCKRTRFH